jgi:hypothetical protein
MAVHDDLPLDNDYYMEVGPIAYQDIADGLEKLRSGWTDVKAKLCLTAAWDAPAVNASLDVVLAEEGSTGVYRGAFDGAALSTHMTASLGVKVYLHIYRQQDYHVVSGVTPVNRAVA